MSKSEWMGIGIVLLMFGVALLDWLEMRDHQRNPEKNRRRLEARWKRLDELYRVPKD